MSPTEYQQLVEFLGHQCAQVERHFTEVDRRHVALLQSRIEEIEQRLDS